MESLTYDEMLHARFTRNANYDGRFYIGIKTMKIFCLPSCKAKLAKKENTVFFESREEAIQAGFRGCLRCKSEYYPNIHPIWLDEVLLFIKANVHLKINEKLLSTLTNVDITTIRRVFVSCFGLSPIAYHRRLRLVYAKTMIEEGIHYTQAMTECGFRSTSSFRKAFVKEFGFPPGEFSHV